MNKNKFLKGYRKYGSNIKDTWIKIRGMESGEGGGMAGVRERDGEKGRKLYLKDNKIQKHLIKNEKNK